MELDERAHNLLKRFDQIQSQNQREMNQNRDLIFNQCDRLAREIDSNLEKKDQSLKILIEFGESLKRTIEEVLAENKQKFSNFEVEVKKAQKSIRAKWDIAQSVHSHLIRENKEIFNQLLLKCLRNLDCLETDLLSSWEGFIENDKVSFDDYTHVISSMKDQFHISVSENNDKLSEIDSSLINQISKLELILESQKEEWEKFQEEIEIKLKNFSKKATTKLQELKTQREGVSEEIMGLIESIIIKLKSQIII